jgi:hypothetical protein
MSRMLDALKQIEARRPPAQPAGRMDPSEGSINPQDAADAQTAADSETAQSTPDADDIDYLAAPAEVALYEIQSSDGETDIEDRHDSDSTDGNRDVQDAVPAELHSEILEEIDKLQLAIAAEKGTFSESPVLQYPEFDSRPADEILDRLESALVSAATLDAPDVYEEAAQYILLQLSSGLPAAFVFTSPNGDTEQTETLFSLSKTLGRHLGEEVFVLDALHPADMMQNRASPETSDDWMIRLDELKLRHKLTLIIAPPLTNFQTPPIMSCCDGVYLILALGRTTPYDVHEAKRVIRLSGGRLLGCLLIAG